MAQETIRIVVITGGSNGIGLALAEEFARHNHNLLLVARDEQKLHQAKIRLEEQFGISCETLGLDLSLSDSAEELYRYVRMQQLTVDVLVNNAGFGTWGMYSSIDAKRSEQEMQLNMVSLSLLTNYFVKDMVTRGSGKILNVASTAAYQPGPMMAVYYSTKAYVVSFSEALWQELAGTGVTVTALCPGPTQTGFQAHAGMANMHLLRKIFMMNAKEVAVSAYDGLMKGKRVVIPGLVNNIVAFSVRFLPKRLVLSVVASLHKRRG